MNRVTVLPLDLTLEVEEGQTVMQAAHAAGYTWPTECEANASCGLCVSIIREGIGNCGEIGAEEKETLYREAAAERLVRHLVKRLQAG